MPAVQQPEEPGGAFAEAVGSAYIANAHKPSTGNYLKACEVMGISRDEAVFVGDQLFTDVYGAKRSGIYQILVKPIHPKEEIQIVLKRKLEKIVLSSYAKRNLSVTEKTGRPIRKRIKNGAGTKTVEKSEKVLYYIISLCRVFFRGVTFEGGISYDISRRF